MTPGSAPRLGDPLASAELVDDPYPFLARLRREAPVWRVPGTDATRSRPARGLRGT